MTVWIARASLVLALILAVALGVQTWRLNRARGDAATERAERQHEALRAAGWKQAAEASQAELARIVPALEAEIAALRRTAATLAGSSHWTGSGAPVTIPCPDSQWPPAGDPTAAPPGPPPPTGSPGATLKPSGNPGEVNVTPHVLIDDAVALADDGGIYVARHVQARLSVGESWMSEWGDIQPDPSSTVKISPDLVAALRALRSPPYRLEALVGLSVGLDGPGVSAAILGGRGRIGWYAQGDYVFGDPSRSRMGGGIRISARP